MTRGLVRDVTCAVACDVACAVACAALAVLSTLLGAGVAHAEPQLSVRLATGGGAIVADAGTEGVFELALRSELLFGGDRVDVVRAGPAVDLRTGDFVTAEAAGGASILLPIIGGFPLVLTAGAGWASRPGDTDGAFALGTLAFGYRPYNSSSPYGYGLQLYATMRYGLDAAHAVEVTGGIEIDLEFLSVIPFMFLWVWLTEGDPDEPED